MLLATVFFSVFFGLYAVVLLLLLWPQPRLASGAATPRVSILIAARNEATTIQRCLRALAQLNYPPEQLEILIGDDASTDDTREIVQRFIADKPWFRLLPIRHRLGTARGKSNVLAHLCRAATSNYFLITDADMALAPDWVQTMLAAARRRRGHGRHHRQRQPLRAPAGPGLVTWLKPYPPAHRLRPARYGCR